MRGLQQTARFMARDTGYQAIQKTKPQARVRRLAPPAWVRWPGAPARGVAGGLAGLLMSTACAQTLGYALNDSPVGLAAWITEKYHSWTDCEGNLETCVTKDELLCNISVYWCGKRLSV